MGRETSRSETTLRDNVRLFVDFRDAPVSQIYDYIVQLSDLVRTVAAFTYLIIDARDRPDVLKAIHDLDIEDYVYLDLAADHRLDQLAIDMVVTTSQRIQLYENTPQVVSGRVPDRSILEDLSWYVGRREDRERVPPAFADVCAIAKRDADIYEEVLRMVRGRKCAPCNRWRRASIEAG